MVVYHGSPRNFKKLRIDKKLVRHNASLENEGCGIYITTDVSIAKSYGNYIYELEVADKYIRDFRNLRECTKYLREIRNYIMIKTGIDIAKYIDLRNIAISMQDATIAISGTCHEIYLMLDSNEYWYSLPNSKIKKVYSILRAYDKRNLKVYMFNYMIKNVGICKTVDEDVVRIIGKHKV